MKYKNKKINLEKFPSGFSKMVQTSFLDEGITSVEVLTSHTKNELLQIYGIGPLLVERIIVSLKEKGLSLK